jgi:hypothetical protein
MMAIGTVMRVVKVSMLPPFVLLLVRQRYQIGNLLSTPCQTTRSQTRRRHALGLRLSMPCHTQPYEAMPGTGCYLRPVALTDELDVA